ncbi:EF-hand calcium-binding domain-containing protein 10-like [Amphiura filiformis]|uniref:EF-hand calcium-binding domain-containing protein 10-like n=1 Tax=Amphiura filiformis TaxID=82378 RepID=UPI003B216B84
MSNPREKEATNYLDQHKILELFDHITSELIFHRPDNPKAFMLDYIAKTKEARTTQMDYPCLFDNSNIESVFGMLDPTKKGFISLEQYTQALQTLGCKDFDERPPGSGQDRITQDTFTREIKQGLKKSSAAFRP